MKTIKHKEKSFSVEKIKNVNNCWCYILDSIPMFIRGNFMNILV